MRLIIALLPPLLQFSVIYDILSNMLAVAEKTKLIKEFKAHETDTGSSEVQIALVSKEIERLSDHLKKHAKDNHSRRGLLRMVSKRKKLLDYLSQTDEKRYGTVIKKLGLRK